MTSFLSCPDDDVFVVVCGEFVTCFRDSSELLVAFMLVLVDLIQILQQ